mmetsp:Transcript_12186/g.24609  ORF Transcript_12186/g.24609 Transcript_12186/m.24609 type:complete len:261 (-) Transcript_12186:53-835(-)
MHVHHTTFLRIYIVSYIDGLCHVCGEREEWSLLALLVDPRAVRASPIDELVGFEPEVDFLLRGLGTIRSMADVTSDFDAEVSTDGSREGLGGGGGAKHLASSGDDVLSLPHHRTDWTGREIGSDVLEERLGLKVVVVTLGLGLSGTEQFHANELEALLFETADDLSDVLSLHSIRLDGDEGPFHVGARLATRRNGADAESPRARQLLRKACSRERTGSAKRGADPGVSHGTADVRAGGAGETEEGDEGGGGEGDGGEAHG